MKRGIDMHPVVIVQDRYGGVYSGGAWLAVGGATTLENGAYRVIRTLEEGPHGDDVTAGEFWMNPPDWIAVGSTPDLAFRALQTKLRGEPA
jgi:hypothetical protein